MRIIVSYEALTLFFGPWLDNRTLIFLVELSFRHDQEATTYRCCRIDGAWYNYDIFPEVPRRSPFTIRTTSEEN